MGDGGGKTEDGGSEEAGEGGGDEGDWGKDGEFVLVESRYDTAPVWSSPSLTFPNLR